MAVKIDKEALLKNRFWIMLGVAVPMALFAIYVLRVDIASAIEKSKKQVDTALKGMMSYSAVFPSQEQIDKLQHEVKTANGQVDVVWGKVFEKQIPYMDWPVEFEEKHPFETGKFIREIKESKETSSTEPNHFVGTVVDTDYNSIRVKNRDNKEARFFRTLKFEKQFKGIAKGSQVDVFYQTARYFNDKLQESERADYDNTYLSQIRPILDLVQPVNEDGEGVVQLRGWQAPKDPADQSPPSAEEAAEVRFLRWVPKWNLAVDISEEAWMAQEDLWIQKDIYRAIRDANDQVSMMHGAAAEGFEKTATFKNPYFEIGLTLPKGGNRIQVALKNLRDSRQKLEIAFLIRTSNDPKQPKDDWDRVTVDGEPLDPAGSPKDHMTKEIPLKNAKRTGIYEVEQVLTWETAAVRRIDHIAIGSASLDDMSINHRMFPEGVRPLELAVEPKKEEGDKRPDRRGDMMHKHEQTVNGLVKERYVEVNEQARRLPVGVALIVDQVHLGRIMKSFENSKFRFVVNQTLLNRYPGSLRPQTTADKDRPGVPKAFPGRGEGGRFGPRPIVPPTGEETFESNVELVIYGTVTLYQRYPPRAPASSAPQDADAKQ